MSDKPLLDLAESYYTVAKDLDWRARYQLRMAEELKRRADVLCEQHMKANPVPEPTADQGTGAP